MRLLPSPTNEDQQDQTAFAASVDAKSNPLVIDNRHRIESPEQGAIHALVIGVSEYQRSTSSLKLPSREGPALAAHRFASYLVDEYQKQDHLRRRIGTLRLLLSPLKKDRQRMTPRSDLGEPPPANSETTEPALRDWARDCNSSSKNLAILFVAGHGVYGQKGATLFLLSDAPARAVPGAAAVALALVEEQMADCAATQNLYVYDCCAASGTIEGQRRAMALDDLFDRSPGTKRGGSGKVTICAAKAGTQTYSLGGQGTLLSRSLLGEFVEHTSEDALLRTAGEIHPRDLTFGITSRVLNGAIAPQFAKLAPARGLATEYEPSVFGSWDGECPVTIPAPPPTFEVTLTGLLRNGRTSPVSISFVRQGGAASRKQDPVVVDEDRVSIPLEAGKHQITLTSSTGVAASVEVAVDRVLELEVPV